jgi:hypothetical protein
MIGPADLLLGVLLPVVVTACILVAAVWLGGQPSAPGDATTQGAARHGAPRRVGAALVPLAAGIGCAVALAGVAGHVPAFPPPEAQQWLFYAALVAAIAEAILVLTQAPRWVGAVVICTVAAFCLRGALRFKFNPDFDGSWSPAVGFLYIGTLAVLAAATWAALSHAAEISPLLAPTAAWGTATLAAVVLAATGGIGLGQSAGAVAIVAFVEVVTKLVARRRGAPIRNITAAAVPAVCLSLLIILGVLLSSMPIGYALVFAATPLLLFAATRLPLGRMRPWQQFVLRAAVVAIPLLIVAGIAARQAFLQQDEINSDAMQ